MLPRALSLLPGNSGGLRGGNRISGKIYEIPRNREILRRHT